MPGLCRSSKRLLRRYEPRGKLEFSGAGRGQVLTPLRPNVRDDWVFNINPKGFAFVPINFPLPITDIHGGMICITPDLADFKNIEARHGADRIVLTQANLELAAIKEQVRFRTLDGTVTLSGQDQPYPRWLQTTINQTHPAGLFRVSGSTFTDRSKKPFTTGYKFNVSTDDAHMAMTPRRLPVEHVMCDCVVTPESCTMADDPKTGQRGFHGSAFGGEITGAFILLHDKNMVPEYHGQAQVKNINVEAAAKAWLQKDEVNPKLKGNANGQIQFAGRGKSAEHNLKDSFQANGFLDISNGYFWSAPVVQTVVGQMKLADASLSAGEAAADFSVSDDVLTFKQAAIRRSAGGPPGQRHHRL